MGNAHGFALADELVVTVRTLSAPPRENPDLSLEIDGFLAGLDEADRLALLKAAVERMPSLRHDRTAGAENEGVVLYETVCKLYGSKSLAPTEDDLVQLLAVARHLCGHGGDTRPPFDLALRHQRKHGYSDRLQAAIQQFAENLPNRQTAKVTNLKRSAALLTVLDGSYWPDRDRPAWIDGVRAELATVDEAELVEWRRLIVAMTASERVAMPASWSRIASSVIDAVGQQNIERRLIAWWPPERQRVSVQGSGDQLLKHFIWLLTLLRRETVESLACRVADMEWYPYREPVGVLRAALIYLDAGTSPQAAVARTTIERRRKRGTHRR